MNIKHYQNASLKTENMLWNKNAKNAYFVRCVYKNQIYSILHLKSWPDIKGSHFDHLISKWFIDDGSLASLEMEDY